MTASHGNGDLERYLLGLLPDEARDRIDQRLLVDSELFELLCVVENELAYDYALGLLTPDERHRFEARFLDRPAVRARVRTAASVIDGIRAAEVAPAKPQWWLYAAAAASILLIAWLAWDNARLRQAAGPEGQLASTPALPSAPAPPSVQEVPATANSSKPSPTVDTPASIVALALQPGVVRSDRSPSRVRLRQTDSVRIELALPASSPPSPGYRVSIRNPDDVQVWEGSAVLSNAGGAVFTVAAGSLPPNDYEITLYSVRSNGSPEEIASYALSTVRQ